METQFTMETPAAANDPPPDIMTENIRKYIFFNGSFPFKSEIILNLSDQLTSSTLPPWLAAGIWRHILKLQEPLKQNL